MESSGHDETLTRCDVAETIRACLSLRPQETPLRRGHIQERMGSGFVGPPAGVDAVWLERIDLLDASERRRWRPGC